MIDFVALQTALAGQYFLERELGRGGMGVVYLAREIRLDRPVAVKVLPPALAAQEHLRTRFLREARTAAKLAHPHIVPVHRVDEVGPFVYLTMGYVDGGTLADRLRERGGTLPPADVVRIVREVGWALAYAHARGVVHRDVKPDNILLDRESGRALVTDFGIAHISDVAPAERLTGEGLVMGTALYMSPEQAAGEPIDGRSDLYALGVVAYQALAGRPPFEASSAHALLAKHLTQEPPPLSSAIPARLARAVRQCLGKRADERPSTGEALAELLEQALPTERALPAPLRLWLEARDPFFALYALWSAVAGMAGAISLVRIIAGAEQDPTFALACLLAVLAPAVPLGIRLVTRTLGIVHAGYGIAELRTAVRQRDERARADGAQELSPVPVWLARLLRLLAYGSAIACFAILLIFLSTLRADATGQIPREQLPEIQRVLRWLWGCFVLVVVSNVLGNALGVTWPTHSGRGTLHRVQRRFWESRPAGWLVSRMARRRTTPAAFADRHTEHAIGLAADELLAALPDTARHQLGDVPQILRGLAREAEGMRERADALGRRLGELDAPGPSGAADRRAAVRDELRAARDQALGRRDAAVTALEAVRLDLLRVHAAVTPSALTDVVERARLLGGIVDAGSLRRTAADAHAPAG